MIGAALRYVRKTPQIARYVATDPVEVWLRIQAKFAERREWRRPPCPYGVEINWERRLHEILGVAWPCQASAEFWALWPRVIGELEAKGLKVGVGYFGGWNDGEPELVRAIWCLMRHLQPFNIVETGVGRGVTSRFILEALERNGAGHLWSIDLPPPLDPELNEEVGAAVAGRCRDRWSYIRGSSRKHLPGLLASLPRLDLFVHDSIHTEYNTRFELDQAWKALTPGGSLVADDVDLNWGFRSFTHSIPDHPSLVCCAEPFQHAPSRFGKGLFGIVRRNPESA
jgi:predicted O-methyltransferase YrrM